ncbi:endonuclease VII domain-containing protein [bacterium]|nr:endonuclease VII domain-containing protein [bacterium]
MFNDTFRPAPPYVQITSKKGEVAKYRNKLRQLQGNLCAICTEPLSGSGVSLDHQHKNKDAEVGFNGGGLIRGVLCRECNAFEGKIWNNSKRYGKHSHLPTFLRRVADYLERENYPWIHPSEKPKPKVRPLHKRQYAKLKIAYEAHPKLRAVFPAFPEKGKPTKKLLNLFERFGIPPQQPPRVKKPLKKPVKRKVTVDVEVEAVVAGDAVIGVDAAVTASNTQETKF